MSPAYDGLSNEQRLVKAGTHFYHTCNNAIPLNIAKCSFCHRWNSSVETKKVEALEHKNQDLLKKKAELEKQLAKLK